MSRTIFFCGTELRLRGRISFNSVVLRGDGWGWGRDLAGDWYVVRGDHVERLATGEDLYQMRSFVESF
jgi:hypothetical protein